MKVEILPIDGNSQRLDGGAMYGNAPKAVWKRWSSPDEENRIRLSCRGMLVKEPGGRLVLFETGIGDYMDPESRRRFGVEEGGHILSRNLQAQGIDPAQIDVVVLSHLHFDHAGGLLASFEEGAPPRLIFTKARFLVSRAAWRRAIEPHPRDRASFIPGLQELLEASGRLELVDGPHSKTLETACRFHLSEGHTPGLLLGEVEDEVGPVLFAADLVPGRPWVHLPITMGYDRFPELLIDEKRRLFGELAARGGRLFFTHDPEVAIARPVQDAKGRWSAPA